jgi:hypothetical protein
MKQLITNNMKKVTMSLDLAKKMYQGTDEQLKAFALENYPELGKITDRIKTFEDACRELGVKPVDDSFLTPDESAYMKLKVIAKALNEGWKPDWNDSNEYKYYPWFSMSSSGVGFSCDDCSFSRSIAPVGSRLVFKNRELAEYAGKQFAAEYKEFYT